MLPQFRQESRCRCGCSIKHTNKLTGPSPGVTFHFLLSTALQPTRPKRPKGATASPPKSSSTATRLGLPSRHIKRGSWEWRRQRPESPSHKSENPLQALTNAGTKLAEGSAGLLSLLLNSAQGRMDTQAPPLWRTTQMFKVLCWTSTQIAGKNQLQPVLIFMR